MNILNNLCPLISIGSDDINNSLQISIDSFDSVIILLFSFGTFDIRYRSTSFFHRLPEPFDSSHNALIFSSLLLILNELIRHGIKCIICFR